MTDFKPGNLYYDVPEEVYYNHPAISNSDLKLIATSPMDWFAGVRETTKAMELGRAFHCYIGEREKFKTLYAKTPLVVNEKKELTEIRFDKRTAVYKELSTKYQDKELMKHSDFRNLFWTKNSIKSDVNALALMSLTGHSEVTGFFEYENVLCRFRADRIVKKGDTHIIIDFKKVSTRHGMYLTQDVIERYNRTYGCPQQAAFYSDGYQAITGFKPIFVNIYLEMNENKTKSLGCVAAVMPDDILIGEHGQIAYHNAILDYKKYISDGHFPTHSEFIINKQLEMGIIQGGIPSIGIGGWV